MNDKTELEKEIDALAFAAADKMFAHQSFRWQQVVKVYRLAINEWIAHKLQKQTMESEQGSPHSMPNKTYSETFIIDNEKK